MKKIALAAAIAVAASSASAVTVYEGKGLTYKLKGDIQVQYRKKTGDDKSDDIEFDDLEIKNSVTYDLGDGLKAVGQLDFSFDDEANGKSKSDQENLEEAWVGVDFGTTTVTFGKMDTANDEFGVEMAYEDTTDTDAFSTDSGDDVVMVAVDLEPATVLVSYLLDADSEGDDAYDFFVSADIDAAMIMAAYQSTQDADTWGIGAEFDADFATFAADYSSADKESGSDVDVYNLAASFKAGKQTKIAVGMINFDEDGSDDVTEWYANVSYKFPSQKNVKLFAEIADNDEDDSDMGYLAGMQIKF